MLPIVDDVLRPNLMGGVGPLARESSVSVRNLKNGPRTLSDRAWENSPSTEKPKTDTWFAALLLSTLVLIMYARVLSSLARQWWDDPNYGHGIFVPMFAAYVLWCEREQWRAVPRRANNFGLPIMLFAIG